MCVSAGGHLNAHSLGARDSCLWAQVSRLGHREHQEACPRGPQFRSPPGAWGHPRDTWLHLPGCLRLSGITGPCRFSQRICRARAGSFPVGAGPDAVCTHHSMGGAFPAETWCRALNAFLRLPPPSIMEAGSCPIRGTGAPAPHPGGARWDQSGLLGHRMLVVGLSRLGPLTSPLRCRSRPPWPSGLRNLSCRFWPLHGSVARAQERGRVGRRASEWV